MERIDVAVVGAGPFGLSVAAHLAPSCRVRTFGQPMHTWRELMPPDMLMRSHWDETKLSCPGDVGTLHHWAADVGEERVEPLPLRTFLRYGEWFRERFVPESDPAEVVRLEAAADGYALTTSAGEEVQARRVVVAVGAMPFPRIPAPLAGVDDPRVAFAVGRPDDDALGGKRVVVLGGGQNGLESAALALRAGAASVELVVRSEIRWFTPREHWVPRSPLRRHLYRLAYPIVGFGPPPINRFVLNPDLFAALPVSARGYLNRRLLRPGGSPWVRGQVEGAAITPGRTLAAFEARADGLLLTLDDGSVREADRVVVCVGYRFDLDQLAWLSEPLRREIACEDGWPVLDRWFRCSERGLQLVGYPAERRFGPLSRFVAGTAFTAVRAAAAHGDLERAGRLAVALPKAA